MRNVLGVVALLFFVSCSENNSREGDPVPDSHTVIEPVVADADVGLPDGLEALDSTSPDSDSLEMGEPDGDAEDGTEPVDSEQDSSEEPSAKAQLESVASVGEMQLTGLSAPVEVVYTDGNVPHIYGETRTDVVRVFGYITARDRFFMMDLARRLGRGTLSGFVGEAGLSFDMESRIHGIPSLAAQLTAVASPEILGWVQAYCDGVNGYVADVEAGNAEAPSELVLAGGLLGGDTPSDLMEPFEPEDIYSIVAYILYTTSFETGDVGRESAYKAAEDLFLGQPFEALRRLGLEEDIVTQVVPALAAVSAGGFDPQEAVPVLNILFPKEEAAALLGAPLRLNGSLLERLTQTLAASTLQGLRGDEDVFGSNAWAVAGEHTVDGSSLMAGDGHLALGIPSILYQVGLDTRELGGGNLHQLGLVIPGFPLINLGTNGKIAWGQTQLMGDVTDWYAEEIQLDDSGAPVASLFQGEWKAIKAIAEEEWIVDIPSLGSTGGSFSWTRYETFDGRRIQSFEGTPVEGLDPGAGADEVTGGVWNQNGYVMVSDVDADGVISAISFDYAVLDSTSLLKVLDGFGHSEDVDEFREWTRGLVGYSQNLVVSDSNGDVFYTGYQSVPCRGYLPRDESGNWVEGADPNRILDGSLYGGFTIPLNDVGSIDETPQEDPYRCVIPFAESPQVVRPSQGFVYSANNDPGGMSLDGSLTNDKWYYGGPWDVGFRGDTIERTLDALVAENAADVENMAALQGNVESRIGQWMVPILLSDLETAKEAFEAGEADGVWSVNADRYEEVLSRLGGWLERGATAHAGVDTVYRQHTEEERDDAVATMIFNAWYPRLVQLVFDDEGIPGVWRPNSSWGKTRELLRMLESRGENIHGLGSWNSETGESAFFDVLNTPEVESSTGLVFQALESALAFLESEPSSSWQGGFGTQDMEQWMWGLRHVVRFESLLLDLVGSTPEFAFLAAPFSINTAVIPIVSEGSPFEEQVGSLPWFPRPGDNLAVDAGNAGLSGTSFSYSSGPVMRMVVSLNKGEVSGVNVIPGGQSGRKESPFFADQALLWLGNDTLPLRYALTDVVEGASGRETFQPSE